MGRAFTAEKSIVALQPVDFAGGGPDVSGDFPCQGHKTGRRRHRGSGFLNGIKGNIVGDSSNPIDPKLGELRNNGGRTQTMALLAGSPAIDAGDDSSAAGLPPTDQRGPGFARKKDGNGDGRAVVDIGAFEK